MVQEIKVPPQLINNYRADLQSAANLAPKSEQSLYKILVQALTELEELLRTEASIEAIAKNLRSQRHAHGWSFLSGDAGDRASTSAHLLYENVEKQIICIQGKDWYYEQ